MQQDDREEFDVQARMLFACFNVPAVDRLDAYFLALKKMSIAQFARVVEFAIGDEGPSKLPTTHQVWEIHRQIRSRRETIEQPQAPPIVEDHLEFFANRLLFGLIVNRGGLGSANGYASAELEKVLDVKRQVVAFFCELIREGHRDATPAEFVNNMRAQLAAVCVIDEATLDRWRALTQHPDSQQPFPASMGRDRGEQHNTQQRRLTS